MWFAVARFIMNYRKLCLSFILALTLFFGYWGTKIELDYDFIKAIPSDNHVFKEFLEFKKTFGTDDDLWLLGLENPPINEPLFYNQLHQLTNQLKKIPAVHGIVSFQQAITLQKNETQNKFTIKPIFDSTYAIDSQQKLLHNIQEFQQIPLYKNILYNPQSKAYIVAVTIDHEIMYSPKRVAVLDSLENLVHLFEQQSNIKFKQSGLPYLRTIIGEKILDEMILFLVLSLVLSIICLLVFFRSISATLLSLGVVLIGVIWSMGLLVLFNYKITILTSLIPPLIVVIGIPNCIYFLNKFHLIYLKSKDKNFAINEMIGKMSIVTLTCNIAAGIGLGVFAVTKSALLYEFGWIAGLTIIALFFISLLVIPPFLLFLPPPSPKELKYLKNKTVEKFLLNIDKWTLKKKSIVVICTILLTLVSLLGMNRLETNGYVIDDIPRGNIMLTDLKWFEKNFGGILPLEIMIDAHKPKSIVRSISLAHQIDVLCDYIKNLQVFGKPISYIEGLKFIRMAFYNNDSSSYSVPTALELSQIADLFPKDSTNKNSLHLLNNMIDSTQRYARITVMMQDVGTAVLPQYIDSIKNITNQTFDTQRISYLITGGSVTFLEGAHYIIKGLVESIIWAFVLISICMLLLFRSWRILCCSLIPNIIPLLFTAGIMGWGHISIKPSTVLIFSVSLGIVIDITIRFLINYQQELKNCNYNIAQTVSLTIKQTGLSIVYTSLVLIAGFIIFSFSNMSTISILGWLTSLTLFMGTLTNLLLLPILIIKFFKPKDS